MRNLVLRAGVLVVLGLSFAAAPASAHTSFVSSDPRDGSDIAVSPETITLTFSDDVREPVYVAVIAPDGSTVKVADIRPSANVVSARLAPSDQRGRFTATYRVVSADGHPVEGSIRWTTTTGRVVKQDESVDEGFVERNRSHFFWGILGAALAIALLLAPLRGRDDTRDA